MKLSCLPVSLFSEYASRPFGAADWAEDAQKLGLDGFDISVLLVKNRTPVYLEELESRLRRLTVRRVMMTTYPDFTAPDPAQCRREAAYCAADIALASQLGFRYLRITPGQMYEALSRKEGIQRTCDAFLSMAETAKAFGVELLFENHTKPGAWSRFDFSYEIPVFLEICDAIRGSGIGVLLDTGNAASCGYDPMTLLDRVYPMVRAIHITDTLEFGTYEPCPIGSGAVPNARFLQELRSRGFDGWVSVEDESGTGFDGTARACAYIRRFLTP